MTLRPRYHFTPPQNFMNDPNGLVFFDGEYHLFYQYNPFGNIWGHMSWGHAISRDLIHWEHLPVALYEADGVMIFSGSAVVDWKNTSGFGMHGEPPLIAIYTGHSTQQTQNIAYSTDHGQTWTKYAGNPVIDIGSAHFRDPKVIWHAPTEKWIMVTVLANQQKILFFGSTDLKHWTRLSDFGPAGIVDNEWECPDLIPMQVEEQPDLQKWILKVDVNHSILGQYFIGHFDGTRFINDHPDNQVLRVDYGKDFYASQSWSDAPNGRHIWIGWMNNWDYANVIPTSPWRGLFSVLRELSLRQFPEGLRLMQQPIEELKQLRQLIYQFRDADVATVNHQLATLNLDMAQEIMIEVVLGTALEFGIKTCNGENEAIRIGYDTQSQEMFVDRNCAGDNAFSEKFGGRHRAPLTPEQNKISLHIFVDSCTVEVFGNNGQSVITDLVFTSLQSFRLELYALDGYVHLSNLAIWNLNPESVKI